MTSCRPCLASGVTVSGLTFDAAEAEMAHGCVDHLGLACCRSIAVAILRGAQVGPAFDDFAGNLELGLAGVVASFQRAASCRGRTAANRLISEAGLGRVPV